MPSTYFESEVSSSGRGLYIHTAIVQYV